MYKYKTLLIRLLVILLLVLTLSLGLVYLVGNSGVGYIESGKNRIWISPGKVEISNFYPGAKASWDLLIHNDTDHTTQFNIAYKNPDYVETGYSLPTDSVKDWITIETTNIFLNPYESQATTITLELLPDAEVPGNKWEFWISVIDGSQEGSVRTELCSRWLVNMR